jgi:lipopolysaccharide transport system permease protein
VSVTVYSPESRLAHPRQLVREMLRDLRGSRELAFTLASRDIRTQYRRSLLGVTWVFIPAVATAVLLSLARDAQIITVGPMALPYPAYVVLSMALWQTFVDALNGPIQALAAEKGLLAKFNVAPEAIILAKLGEALFNCAVRLGLAAALFLWYGVPVGGTLLLAPFGVLLLIALGAGLGLGLAPFSALYQDVPKSLPLALSFWFFLTPVVYPVPPSGLFALVVGLNPVTPLLVATRDLVIGQPLTAPLAFLIASLLALVLLLLGWLLYRLATPIVLERARY